MLFRGTSLDKEFAHQALAEKRLTEAQLNEIIGAQAGLADRGIRRAVPVIAHEFGFLPRPLVEQLIRHVIRRTKKMRLGGYNLLKQIGRGGMGVVYLAQQVSMKRLVALKLLIRRDMSQKFIDRFKREGYACALIRHECLVAAFDVGNADGWHYFAMEYVNGPTITRAVRENGPFSEIEAIRIARQVAEALAVAHDAGIIHRDVKPGNIMIAKNGMPKLCDLGLARIRNVDETELYEPGTTLGSRRYMSPEQARGLEGIDARSDIYSLGLTLFMMVTGTPPFSDVPKDRVMFEHLRGMLEWPGDISPSISDEVSAMIWRMADKDPARRPKNAHQLVAELDQIEDKLGSAIEIGLEGTRLIVADAEPIPPKEDSQILPLSQDEEDRAPDEEETPDEG